MTTLSQPSADLTLRTRFARGIDALRQEWLRSLIMLLAVLTVGGLVLYPLGILFNIGLRTEDGALTLANYYSVLTEPGLVSALINSLIISAATTVLSLVIALPMAWAVARTAMPGRQLLRVAVLIAFVIPNFISVIAWILLLGPNAGLINVFLRDTFGIAGAFNIYSMSGLILVLTFSFYPLIFFAVTAALDNMDPAYEEAAQMAGASAWRASLGVTMPLGFRRSSPRQCSCFSRPWAPLGRRRRSGTARASIP
jgi:iron(III) transport system permease protein